MTFTVCIPWCERCWTWKGEQGETSWCLSLTLIIKIVVHMITCISGHIYSDWLLVSLTDRVSFPENFFCFREFDWRPRSYLWLVDEFDRRLFCQKRRNTSVYFTEVPQNWPKGFDLWNDTTIIITQQNLSIWRLLTKGLVEFLPGNFSKMMLQVEVSIRSFSQSFVTALVEDVALQIFFQTPANNVILVLDASYNLIIRTSMGSMAAKSTKMSPHNRQLKQRQQRWQQERHLKI